MPAISCTECIHFRETNICLLVTVLYRVHKSQALVRNVRQINLLTPNVNYSGRTAPLTSKVAFYIFIQQNIGTEYFKHGIYSPFFFLSLQNSVCLIILTYLVLVLFTFYTQSVLKLKK